MKITGYSKMQKHYLRIARHTWCNILKLMGLLILSMNNQSIKRITAITLAIIPLVLLGGCFNFGGDNTGGTKTSDQNSKLYDTTAFTISVPKDWEVIDKKDFTSDVPAETYVVFRNNVKNETFTSNIVIVDNKLQEPLSSLEYAKRVINRQKTGLYNYTESRKEDFKISVGDKTDDTYFVLFEAKKSQDEKNVRYLQTYAVKGNDAFIVTGAVSPQEDDTVVKMIEDAVKTFKLK
jgi:hypothetical protein